MAADRSLGIRAPDAFCAGPCCPAFRHDRRVHAAGLGIPPRVVPFRMRHPGSDLCVCISGMATGLKVCRAPTIAQHTHSPRHRQAVHRSGGPSRRRQRCNPGRQRADAPGRPNKCRDGGAARGIGRLFWGIFCGGPDQPRNPLAARPCQRRALTLSWPSSLSLSSRNSFGRALDEVQWADRLPASWLRRLPGAALLLRAIARAPTDLLRNPALLGETVILELAVFVLDALTLWLVFRALGDTSRRSGSHHLSASLWHRWQATLGPIPLGLGTFWRQLSCVGMLSLLGVAIE